jgi:hypothetical protein
MAYRYLDQTLMSFALNLYLIFLAEIPGRRHSLLLQSNIRLIDLKGLNLTIKVTAPIGIQEVLSRRFSINSNYFFRINGLNLFSYFLQAGMRCAIY